MQLHTCVAIVLAGAALGGCSKQGANGGTAGSSTVAPGSAVPTPSPAGMTPAAAEAKARAILQHQIDATAKHDRSIRDTFTADAVIFVKSQSLTADSLSYVGLADGGPDGMQTDKATIGTLLAGGNADAVWFYAEVALEMTQPAGGKETATTRVVEVASAAEHWKIVAAYFGEAVPLMGSGANREVEGATRSDGPLAKLLVAPGMQLAPDAIVVGPGHAGRGAAVLAEWKLEPVTIFQRAREVRTPTWGFVQANLDHPLGARTARLASILVAVPGAGGAWSVVLAQYTSQ